MSLGTEINFGLNRYIFIYLASYIFVLKKFKHHQFQIVNSLKI